MKRMVKALVGVGLLGPAALLVIAGLGLSAAPAAARTNIHVSLNLGRGGACPVYFREYPRLVAVPRTSVYYVDDYPDYDVYQCGSDWYSCNEGVWYEGPSCNGPWETVEIEAVPQEVLYAPSGYYHHRHFPSGWAPRYSERRVWRGDGDRRWEDGRRRDGDRRWRDDDRRWRDETRYQRGEDRQWRGDDRQGRGEGGGRMRGQAPGWRGEGRGWQGEHRGWGGDGPGRGNGNDNGNGNGRGHGRHGD